MTYMPESIPPSGRDRRRVFRSIEKNGRNDGYIGEASLGCREEQGQKFSTAFISSEECLGYEARGEDKRDTNTLYHN